MQEEIPVMRQQEIDPRLALFIRLAIVAVAIVLLFGSMLFFAPDFVGPRWPWATTPFNARFLGAIYLAELVGVLLQLAAPRGLLDRIGMPMTLIFTVMITLASFLYLGRFDFGRPIVWVWFVLYIAYIIIPAVYVWAARNARHAEADALPPVWRTYLLAQGIVLGLYGLALFVAPAFSTAFWPWPVDDFHARLYSGVFLTGAVGALLATRGASVLEMQLLGATQVAFGSLAILGTVLVDLGVHRVNWSASGTWVWVAGFAAISLAGLGLLWQARHVEKFTVVSVG